MRTTHIAALIALACMASGAAAEVVITSVPEGANVYIDDAFIGVTPITVDVVQPGAHLLRVERRGFAPLREAFVAADGPVAFHAALVPATQGGLALDSAPQGASVFIDGELRGTTPLVVAGLAPGIHGVRMTLEGYATWDQDVEVAVGGPQPVSAELDARIESYLLAEIEARPEVINNYADLAHHYIVSHDFDAAFETFSRGFDAIAEHHEAAAPDEVRRLTDEIGRVYVAQYDYADDATVAALQPRVIETLEAAIERHPDCGEAAIALADIYRDAGAPDAAREVLERGLAQVQGLVPTMRLKGRLAAQLMPAAAALAKAEDWSSAIAAYEEVVAKLPGTYHARQALEQIATIRAARQSDFAGAIATLRTLLSEYPDPNEDPQILQQIATYQRSLEDFAGAAATHEEVADKYPAFENVQTALSQAASIQWKQLEDLDKALELYLRCAGIAPSTQDGTLAAKYAIDILRAKGETDRAAAMAQALMEAYPYSLGGYYVETREDRKARNAAAAEMYQEAAKLARDDDYDGAEAKYIACAEQYPDTYHGMTALTQVISIRYARQKDYSSANVSRRLFVDRYPDDEQAPTHLLYIGYTYQNQIGDLDAAVAAYREFMERYPEHPKAPQVLYYLGLIHYSSRSEFAEGLAAFERLITDYAGTSYYPQGLYYAGECLMSLLEVDRARALWMDLLEQYPGSSVAYEASESFMRIRRRAGRGQWANGG